MGTNLADVVKKEMGGAHTFSSAASSWGYQPSAVLLQISVSMSVQLSVPWQAVQLDELRVILSDCHYWAAYSVLHNPLLWLLLLFTCASVLVTCGHKHLQGFFLLDSGLKLSPDEAAMTLGVRLLFGCVCIPSGNRHGVRNVYCFK